MSAHLVLGPGFLVSATGATGSLAAGFGGAGGGEGLEAGAAGLDMDFNSAMAKGLAQNFVRQV